MKQPIEGQLRYFQPITHYHTETNGHYSYGDSFHAVASNKKVLQQYIGGEWINVPTVHEGEEAGEA